MKHFKTFISVVVILISFFSMPTKAQSRYDVNSDGKVNITDAISVVNKILNGSSDNENTPAEAVDLGLPSGTKWASYNLGASSPEDPGGRYAWGETVEKLVYNRDTYVNYDKSTGKFRNIGNDICGSAYDAAHVNWGGLWYMPSQADYEELMTFCTYEWTTFKGVQGGKFTGPNGNSIFLPINPSLEWGNKTYWLGYDDGGGAVIGYYGDQSTWYANSLFLRESIDIYDYPNHEFRSDGLMIRPVYSNTSKSKIVDLGLPSGTKWASCNVGASCPEDEGDKYAWGEIGTKLEYTWDNYLFFDSLKQMSEYGYIYDEVVCQDIGNDISGTKYDVAHVKWGGNWRMPTKDEVDELLANCKRNGDMLTGPNGNSIILPLNTSYWTSTLVDYDGSSAYYLCHIQALPGEEWLSSYEHERFEGFAVRPIYSPSPTVTSGNRVDLGLPSGTKWASCNVGASKPEEYGDYYAWGETEEKELYDWKTYIHCDGSYNDCHDIGNISGTKYDVARIKLGISWQTPTIDQVKELYFCCIVDWITLNGVNGWKFTSKINGNSIFLPAAGYREESRLNSLGEIGHYWSGTIDPDFDSYAMCLRLYRDYIEWDDGSDSRKYGFPVRPVSK